MINENDRYIDFEINNRRNIFKHYEINNIKLLDINSENIIIIHNKPTIILSNLNIN